MRIIGPKKKIVVGLIMSHFAGSELLTAELLKILVFFDVALRIWVNRCRCFYIISSYLWSGSVGQLTNSMEESFLRR
jgi:hypothetical protein